jgi:tetratricopeptide (TPR) repeat protein
MPKHLRSAALLSTLTLFALGSSTFLASMLLASPARADDSSDAKMHYQKATAHYAVGEYHDAAMEYEAAYKAKQDPALLYNAAQSHRLANDNQKALLLYKNIVKLYPTSKYAAESKDRIGKLEQAIATTQSPPNQPAPVVLGAAPAATPAPVQPLAPQPAPSAAPLPAAPPPATTAAAPAATLTATAPPPEGATPIYEKWWFWTGAGVVVAAAVVGIVLATSSTKPWNNVANVNGSMP